MIPAAWKGAQLQSHFLELSLSEVPADSSLGFLLYCPQGGLHQEALFPGLSYKHAEPGRCVLVQESCEQK